MSSCFKRRLARSSAISASFVEPIRHGTHLPHDSAAVKPLAGQGLLDEVGVFAIDDDSRAEHQVPDAEIVDVHLQVEQLDLLDRFGQQLVAACAARLLAAARPA